MADEIAPKRQVLVALAYACDSLFVAFLFAFLVVPGWEYSAYAAAAALFFLSLGGYALRKCASPRKVGAPTNTQLQQPAPAIVATTSQTSAKKGGA